VIAAFGVVGWAILLTYSRGGMIGFAAVLALCALRWSGRRARPAVTLAVGLALAVAIGTQWRRGEGFRDLAADRTVEQRLETVRAGLAMAADRPLTGVGLGCSLLGYERYTALDRASTKSLHSHNTLVQALAETGVFGFALFGAVVAAALARTRRRARELRAAGHAARSRSVSAIEIALWGFLVCGLAGGYLLSWFPYLLFGLASAVRDLPDPPGSAVRRPNLVSTGAPRCAASPAF
jgi:O-antigen ligase